MLEHKPNPPSWTCWECRRSWPCEQARAELLALYQGSSYSLIIVMSSWMRDAMRDLPAVASGDMHYRFLGWAENQRSRNAGWFTRGVISRTY